MYILVDGGSDMLKPGITNSLRDYYAFEHIYKFFGTLFEFTSYISPEIEAVG